jgi:aldose 1-epimerase
VEDKKSGIVMDTYTDLPGVQFYAGNFVGKDICKGGILYGPRKGLCLETQYYPNSANEVNFPRPLYGPDKAYDTTTVYKFYLS